MNTSRANSVSQWLTRGVALHQQGRLPEAEALYRQILRAEPGHFDALHLSGLIAHQGGDAVTAAGLIRRALAVNPREASAHCNLGSVLQQLGQIPEAIASFNQALGIRPDFAEAYFNRGIALQALHRWEDAVHSYDSALLLRPDFAAAHCNRGFVLDKLHRFGEALASFERAIALDPGMSGAWLNRCALFRDLGETHRALESSEAWIQAAPSDPAAHIARGNALTLLREWHRASASYDRAIDLSPDCGEAHFSKSLALLQQGDLENGWREHEWRWKNLNGPNIKDPRHFSCPLWLGQYPLEGKRILLYGEQGFGDVLQFCRYAQLVAERGGQVLLEVREPLYRLMRSLAGPVSLFRRGDQLPQVDYHCPVGSLPLAFCTRLDSIPAPRRYLAAETGKIAEWHARLGPKTRPRIGLVWRSGAQMPGGYRRDVPLAELLRSLPAGYQYVSLQKEFRGTDREVLRDHTSVVDFAECLHDFSDTAALCECMDLVVSVDTSLAHLAGALGATMWLLLPRHPDWRWLLDREDSPWYPTMTLLRQERAGEWSGVLREMALRIETLRAA
jgi:tetratricopeptide (TPR) repeat protein